MQENIGSNICGKFCYWILLSFLVDIFFSLSSPFFIPSFAFSRRFDASEGTSARFRHVAFGDGIIVDVDDWHPSHEMENALNILSEREVSIIVISPNHRKYFTHSLLYRINISQFSLSSIYYRRSLCACFFSRPLSLLSFLPGEYSAHRIIKGNQIGEHTKTMNLCTETNEKHKHSVRWMPLLKWNATH